MASIYDLKPKFQALLRPLCGALASAGVTANQVTIAALLLSTAYGAAIYFKFGASLLFIFLPLVLFIRMAMNAIDGMLAREFGQKSDLGAILNEITDVAADAALYLPFVLLGGFAGASAVLIVMLAAVGELTGVVAQTLGASRRYDGPFGKSDRAFFFGAVALALGFDLPAGLWTTVLFSIALALSAWTIVNRARAGLKEAIGSRHG